YLPRLSASRAAGRLPGERRPRSLSKGSSDADPPSRPDGSDDAVHGQTQPSAAAHHAGIPVEPPVLCWNVGPARGRRLHAGPHLERNRLGVGTAEGLSDCGPIGSYLDNCVQNSTGAGRLGTTTVTRSRL